MSRAFVKLHTGKRFYFDDIMANEVDIEDIACGLSHQCRYGGQMGNIDDYYTVAEHSVYVSLKVEEELRNINNECKSLDPNFDNPTYLEEEIRVLSLCGLLHDATEGIGMCDMVSPLKKLDKFYKAKEQEVEAFFAKRFKTPYPFPRIIKATDLRMFACEYPQIFPDDAENVEPFNIVTIPHDGTWDDVLADSHPYPELKLKFLGPRKAFNFFMKRFVALGGR